MVYIFCMNFQGEKKTAVFTDTVSHTTHSTITITMLLLLCVVVKYILNSDLPPSQ